MTAEQREQALRLRGTMPRLEICARVQCSLAALMRLGREHGLSFSAHRYRNNPQLVAEVLAFYAEHGKKETAQQYTHVNIRSVVDHYQSEPVRQKRWEPSQILELARMAGIISCEDQAAYFSRPRAGKKSIRSFWAKRGRAAPSSIHGLPMYQARFLCRRSVATIGLPGATTKGARARKHMVLWVDAEAALKDGLPEYLTSAIATMADFQRWLYGTPNVRDAISELIRTRRLSGEEPER